MSHCSKLLQWSFICASSDVLPMCTSPADTYGGKLQPKSQLMIYLGTASRNECNYLFMYSNNALHTYTHAIFDENLFLQCPRAWPHKLISRPVQLHQHPKLPSHPPSEVASEDNDDDLPRSLRHHKALKLIPLCKLARYL